MVTTKSFWVTRPGSGELREENLREPTDREVLIHTSYTAVSPGTERLVGLGRVPQEVAETMQCRGMAGGFNLPIKYGYHLVGEVTGKGRCFTMHPHQNEAVADSDHVVWLPDMIDDLSALLIPSVETALNAWWDSRGETGESIAVVGGGLIGCCVASVATAKGAEVILFEQDERRAERLAEMKFLGKLERTSGVRSGGHHESFDLCFHCSGTEEGLALAISLVGFEGTVLEMSWYGDRPVRVPLGGSFHARRKRLVGSQVSAVSDARRGEIDHAGRMSRVLRIIESIPDLASLIEDPIDFENMPSYMTALYQGQTSALLQPIQYP